MGLSFRLKTLELRVVGCFKKTQKDRVDCKGKSVQLGKRNLSGFLVLLGQGNLFP